MTIGSAAVSVVSATRISPSTPHPRGLSLSLVRQSGKGFRICEWPLAGEAGAMAGSGEGRKADAAGGEGPPARAARPAPRAAPRDEAARARAYLDLWERHLV